jgi:hypothetical protein
MMFIWWKGVGHAGPVAMTGYHLPCSRGRREGNDLLQESPAMPDAAAWQDDRKRKEAKGREGKGKKEGK